MNADPTWFYEKNGERFGPVSAEAILDLYRRGDLSPDNLVWRRGFENWIPYSSSELASAPPPSLPVAPSSGPPSLPAGLEPFAPRPAALRSGYQPQIRASFDRGWKLLIANFWPIVGCFALTSIILSVASQFIIPIFILTYPLLAGFYWYLLRQVRGQEATVEMLFEGFRRQFGPLAIVNLIVTGIGMAAMIPLIILISVGFVVVTGAGAGAGRLEDPSVLLALFGGSFLVMFLVSIPLMILAQVGSFASLLILDCGLQAKEAMSLAWTAVKPFLFKFWIFIVLSTLLSMAGMFALYVGMFITGAWASIALVYLYEDAFGDEKPSQPTIR